MNKWKECEVFLSQEQIQERIRELGAKISEDYRDREILAVGVLKGAFVFMADLIRNIDADLQVDFIAVSSYGSGTESSGNVKIKKDLSCDPKGKNILLIEDIIDTGNTLKYLKDVYLPGKGADSVRICTLLDKPDRRTADVTADYCGFQTEDRFIIGYGLDYAENGRNLRDIRYIE